MRESVWSKEIAKLEGSLGELAKVGNVEQLCNWGRNQEILSSFPHLYVERGPAGPQTYNSYNSLSNTCFWFFKYHQGPLHLPPRRPHGLGGILTFSSAANLLLNCSFHR